MLRPPLLFLALTLAVNVCAQSPSPSAPAPTARPATPTPAKPSPTPTPVPTPTTAELINAMGSGDLQQVLPLLKSNYISPEALNQDELDRALLQGLLTRLGRGLMLLPDASADHAAAASPFHAEILDSHIGYLRLGAFTKANLQEMDANLQTFVAKKVDAVVVDLRASPMTNDFALAADFAKRFCPKGKLLFTLRKPGAKQESIFTSNQEPVWRGLLIVLADGDTAGAPEAMAGALRHYEKAMVIGQPTAGRAVEYSDLALPSGKILRAAVAEAVLPEGLALFPGGIKPDLPVEMSAADKAQVFAQSAEKGMAQFVFETDRPHMNEAALQAGTNPELEAMQAAQQRRGRGPEKAPLRDPVMQRAVDLVTSISILGKQAPPP